MKDPFVKSDKKITVIGGGTGSFMMLSALKKYTNQIAAIVNMVDDGGSTGVLRDELGTLPPGDVRQCLVALSDSEKIRDLFNYRFEEGIFEGHAFGNLLLTALEKITGSFDEAVHTAAEILHIKGIVIPATLDNVHLKMEWPKSSLTLQGQREISDEYFQKDPRKAVLSLVPSAKTNDMAIKAIKQADIVVISPGDLYSSLGPLLILDEIAEALQTTSAPCVYVCNLVTKHGQTEGFTVGDHADEIERFVGAPFLDYILYNQQVPDKKVAKRYKAEDAFLVKIDKAELAKKSYKAIPGDFLGPMAVRKKADLLHNRSLIRHDADTVAKAIIKLTH